MPRERGAACSFLAGLLGLLRLIVCLPRCLLGRSSSRRWSALRRDEDDPEEEGLVPGGGGGRDAGFSRSSAQAPPPAWLDLDIRLSDFRHPVVKARAPGAAPVGAAPTGPGAGGAGLAAGPLDLIDILAEGAASDDRSKVNPLGADPGAGCADLVGARALGGAPATMSTDPRAGPADLIDIRLEAPAGGALTVNGAGDQSTDPEASPTDPAARPASLAGITAKAPAVNAPCDDQSKGNAPSPAPPPPAGWMPPPAGGPSARSFLPASRPGRGCGARSVAHQLSMPTDFRAAIFATAGPLPSPFASAATAGSLQRGSSDPIDTAGACHKRATSGAVRRDLHIPAPTEGPDRCEHPAAASMSRARSAPAPLPPSDPDSESGEAPGVPKAPRRESESSGSVASGRRAHVLCASAEDIGQRRSMEDRNFAGAGPDARIQLGSACPAIDAFLGVFDGHNGSAAAQFAADRLLPFLADAFATGCGLAGALELAFDRCESTLLDSWRSGSLGDAGTTALVALLSSSGILHLANAGDCRAVISRGGRAEALTRDHKPGAAGEKDRILARGGFLDDDGYLNGEIGVSRCFGDFHLTGIKTPAEATGPLIASPEVLEVPVGPDCEFVIVGSDGLWDVLSNQKAVDLVRAELEAAAFNATTPSSNSNAGSDPEPSPGSGSRAAAAAERAVERLVFEAKLKESRDNITAGLMVLAALPLAARKCTRRRFVNSRLRLNSRSLMDLKAAIQSAETAPLPRPV